jgi:hypothetical protein
MNGKSDWLGWADMLRRREVSRLHQSRNSPYDCTCTLRILDRQGRTLDTGHEAPCKLKVQDRNTDCEIIGQ